MQNDPDKKNLSFRRFYYSSEPQNENEKKSDKMDKYLDLARELKKAVEHESDDDTYFKKFLSSSLV